MLPTPLPGSSGVARAARAMAQRDDGYVLGFHPVSRANPFQRLLYSRGAEAGFTPVGLTSESELEAIELAPRMGAKAILHLHWTSGIIRGAADVAEARTLARTFLSRLESLQNQGVQIVWTVHNVLPHRCEHPGVEAELRGGLCELVDAIHVMAQDTAAATAPYYTLPEQRIIQVSHPSYSGAYPGHIDREMARLELGFEASDVVVGVVGSIQPYKGVGDFEAALDAVAEPRLRGVVAGIPGRDADSMELMATLRKSPRIDLFARKLSDLEMATIVTGLDAMVLPYRASLNSGAAMLGATFGVPMVVPRIGSFRELIDLDLAQGYDLEARDGLETALRSVESVIGDHDPEASLRFAQERAAPAVSTQFFAELRRLLEVSG